MATRNDIIAALRAAGYDGPVSYSVSRLHEIAEGFELGTLPTREPRPAREPRPRVPDAATAARIAKREKDTAARLLRKPWEAGLPSNWRTDEEAWRLAKPGTPCLGRLHSYDAGEGGKQRCCGRSTCTEDWVARGLVVDPDFVPYWRKQRESFKG